MPEIAGATLVLSSSEALEDGAARSQSVLNELSAHFPRRLKDSGELREYLRGLTERERGIVATTRVLYMYRQPADSKPPIFFEDFDRRLIRILREVGATPNQTSEAAQQPKFVLVQMPKANESVDAKPPSSTTNKTASDLGTVINDFIRGCLGLKNSGTTVFTWSLESEPTKATVYVSRLDESETKLTGVTNYKDEKLPYALWTFRIDFGGCSKTEQPNPFLQSDIRMTVTREGCKKQ